MHRELIVPFSLRIGEETLRKGYEEQDKKYIQQKIYFNGIFNIIITIVLLSYVGTQSNQSEEERIISLSLLGVLLVINILLLISYKYFIIQLQHIQSIYEIMVVQVILYIAKVHLSENSDGNNLINGMVIGASLFNAIIGYSFVNKMVMNLYAIFMMTIYQFTSQEGSSGKIYFIIFVILYISLSSSKGYLDEKQRRKLYICSQQKHYLGDSIITHTPVGIMATKFNDSTMKFELLSMNAKAQQLLHLDQNQASLDTFLKTFEIDQEQQLFNRSDLSNKQSVSKEQQGNGKKKQDNEMSLFMQCRFHMMKMVPAYPRDLQQRLKKRNNSNGKSYILSGSTEKETDITTKNNINNNNNINTHTVTAEVKQFNGHFNSLYLSLQLSTYYMMGDDKYAIFCINTDPYKRDYHSLKNRNNKYQSFFTSFWSLFEKSLVTQIRDWKAFYSEYKQVQPQFHCTFSPRHHQREGVQSFQGSSIPHLMGQQNLQQQNYMRACQTKKSSQKSQTDSKPVKSLQKILQLNDGGYSQIGSNYKQLNSQQDDGLDNQFNSSFRSGSQAAMQFSPKKDNKQQINGGFQQQYTTQDNSKEQGSMNFDYFCITQESMNNIQQFQSLGNRDNIDQSFGINFQSPMAVNASALPQSINLFNNNNNNNISSSNNNSINQGIQVTNLISTKNQKQIQRVHYNCHRIMYDYQNWNAIYEMEFGQNIIINQRQILQQVEQLDIDRLLTRILSIFEIIRIEKQIKVMKQIKIGNPQVTQNSKKLHIILFNILHNSFLYCKYQATISITISDFQNCMCFQITNDILQEEENSVQHFVQSQFLQESKNFISSVNFDTLNQFSLNFNQGLDQNDNLNNSNNGSHLALLARKKGECNGLKLSRYLLKTMGPSERLKIEVKEQKFTIQFDIYVDVNHLRKKQTSIFQRYKKNSAQINITQTDPNQSNFNQINEEKQPFENVQYSPSEYNNSPNIPNMKRLGQQLFFDKPLDNNCEFTINVHAIDDEQAKIGMELEETYNNSSNKNAENFRFCQYYDNKVSESDIQSDMSEQCQSNLQGMSVPSQLTPNFVMQSKIKTLQFQTMQKTSPPFNH